MIYIHFIFISIFINFWILKNNTIEEIIETSQKIEEEDKQFINKIIITKLSTILKKSILLCFLYYIILTNIILDKKITSTKTV